MKLRISTKNRSTLKLELEGYCGGSLPKRALPLSYPPAFEGEVSDEEAQELCQLLQKQAQLLLMDYLAKSERSSLQCRKLLQRKDFDSHIIEAALQKCRDLNYLNDTRFAETLIRSYQNRRASKRTIIAKLREQMLPAQLWEPILEELFSSRQASEDVKELMKKYCASKGDLPRQKLREKAFAYLFRKGFELEDIQNAWDDLD